MLDIAALCLVATALVAYLNERFVRMPTTIGVTMVFPFMTPEALARFKSAGASWSAGADASIAVLKAGANREIDLDSVPDLSASPPAGRP